MHPERLVDLLAPAGPDFTYEFKDGNPLNLDVGNMRRVWAWDTPRRVDGMKDRPHRREVIKDTERGLVFVPLAGGNGHAVADLEDFERLIGVLNVSDQWYLNANRTGRVYVRSHRRTTDTRSVLSVANEIARAGRGQQVAFIDGNRLNLRRSNLRLVERRGARVSLEVPVDVHVPDNDRS